MYEASSGAMMPSTPPRQCAWKGTVSRPFFCQVENDPYVLFGMLYDPFVNGQVER
jgi:hypothetical protein